MSDRPDVVSVNGAYYRPGEVGYELAVQLQRTLTRLRATEAVLDQRQRELVELVGPCSNPNCLLHRAHSGPCNIPL